ncbi:hypothetical protein PLCT1_00133 [Planctomycetaceae bacterium]|nr:hypothetical protein PLCT1_00133 [Planctomycetaceae bacterium]
MYATCLYCHGHLGRNEMLPRFPVGKRLAFDSGRGRLWVVCRHCARWNLTPVEERWDAIEECERRYRRTRIRVSTDNIGLVELPDGMTLIRIGKPLWPEFAAWRYGRRFSRRRVKTGLAAGSVVTGALGATLGAVAAGFGGAAFIAAYAAGLWVMDEGHKRRPVTTFRFRDRWCHLTQDHAEATRIFSDGGGGKYGLAFHHAAGVELLRGPEARHVLGRVIPTLSPFGGDRRQVTGAIELIDRAGSAEMCIRDTLEHAVHRSGFFTELPVPARLALEMSLQEDGERRALDGELVALERAWREAEQIAAIADSLLMPGDVIERISGIRRGQQRPAFVFG